jgi:hypothetical protein
MDDLEIAAAWLLCSERVGRDKLVPPIAQRVRSRVLLFDYIALPPYLKLHRPVLQGATRHLNVVEWNSVVGKFLIVLVPFTGN